MDAKLQKVRVKNKRRIVTKDECLFDLREELEGMFRAFWEASFNYENEIRYTPVEARARCFEASLLNSKMIQAIQSHYPDNWRFMRYKRFSLRVNSYIVLFKKFNSLGMPMNIQTKYSNALLDQMQGNLFEGTNEGLAEPILFFGYKKNRFGEIVDPQLIFIDENKREWVIDETEICKEKAKHVLTQLPQLPTIKIKERKRKRKRSNTAS